VGLVRARELDVYKLSFAAALYLHKLSLEWPKHEQMAGIADQIRRASKSICANMVEGLGKQGLLEQRRFLNIALGSADEVQVWLEFARDLTYITPIKAEKLIAKYEEISRMLYALMRRRV
jgi:four helix bundle protein